jgi:hypothetical protein
MLTTLALVGTLVSGGLLWRLKGQWAEYHRGHIGRPALTNGVMLAGGTTGLTLLMWVAKIVF